MPSQFVTFRLEYNHRAANVPYFTGEGGVTPPGGNQASAWIHGRRCRGALWNPDLRKTESRVTAALLVKF